MNNLKKRFVMLLVLVGLVLLGSLLVAQQGPPNACANACLENYTAAGIIGDVGGGDCCSSGRTARVVQPLDARQLARGITNGLRCRG